MLNNINLYQSLGTYNQYFRVNSFNRANNLSSISNTCKSSYRNSAYSLYDINNASFVSNYTSTLSGLKGLTTKLSSDDKNSVWNSLSANSSNSKVLTANTFFAPKEKATYSINVKQIATKQINTSNELNSSDLSTFGSFKLNISSNNKNYSFDIDSTNKTNKETLTDIAAKINKNNIGIYATVTEKNNKSMLKLTSDETGEDEKFTVSGSDDFNKTTNINNIAQASQNAIYEITTNGKASSTVEKTSSTNDVDIDEYKISATLKSVGKADITVGTDKDKIYSTASNFVTAYNNTINLLENNADRGSGVTRQLNNLRLSDAFKKELSSIGINSDTDEKLILDEKKFSQAIKDDIDKVQSVLGDRYNAVSSIGNRVERAMREPSINLINNSIYSNNTENSYNLSSNNSFYNQMKLLGLYNRNGQFGLMNYSIVGMLYNIFA